MTFQENYMRVMEQFRELYFEALRAPEDNVTFKRNPYRKEYLTKKIYGKTREERKKTRKDLEVHIQEHKERVDREVVEQEL